MQRYLSTRRAKIQRAIQYFLGKERQRYVSVNQWSNDVFDRLLDFCQKGKMLRGIMVVFAYEACGGKNMRIAYQLAAVMEFLHATLLIHDDIMDRDILRRGTYSIQGQYNRYATQKGYQDAEHFGHSMAINVGDIGFFLALKLLRQTINGHKHEKNMTELVYQELISVGLAQMEDMALGFEQEIPDQGRVSQMYYHKTARYSFILPLLIGTILAGGSRVLQQQFTTMGESLGILYQIKDDELGLFGNAAEVGKTSGLDIIEGKKTMALLALFQACNFTERKKLKTILGIRQTNTAMVHWVIRLMEKYQISDELHAKEEIIGEKVRKIIKRLKVKAEYKDTLNDFLDYNLTRTR